MFEELIEVVNQDIATIRSIIKTNNHLRTILFSKDSASPQLLNNNSQLMNLKQLVPDETPWKLYDHCSVVTRLYSIHESFVENLISSWINYLPQIYPSYSDLPEAIRNTHLIGISNLLLESRKEKSRFGDISVEEIIRGLYVGITSQTEQYDIVAEAFLMHQQNLRKDAIEKLFTDAGIPQSWNWINEHRKIKRLVEDIDNTAEGELAELINYRNDAAHGGIIDDVLGEKKLLDLCDFIENLSEAFFDLVNFYIVERKKELGEIKDIGLITEWFQKPKAGVAKVKNTNLCVGDSLWLMSKTKSYCQSVKIKSIRLTIDDQEIDKDNIEITDETEVGLKFNKNAKKDISLYK